MSLLNLKIKEEYRTGECDLVDEFYEPCLTKAVSYDRAVGYFRSSVFLLIGPALVNFAKKGGQMRLICSSEITNDDYEAMQSGYLKREEILSDILNRNIDEIFHDELLRSNTEAFATLIANGVISVKIAFRPDSNGIYHEKMGVFRDDEGNAVSFKGSVNESWSGWHDRGNYESFDAFCSWSGSRESLRVNNNQEYFQNLWDNKIDAINVYDFPMVVKEKLSLIAKDSIDNIDVEKLYEPKKQPKISPQFKEKREPLPHQKQAVENWAEKNFKGIFEHATGSGKTFTAITAMRSYLSDDGIALILVPDRLLHKQWIQEIKLEFPEATILKAGDGHNEWKIRGRLRDFTQPGEGFGLRIIIATMSTARTNEFVNSVNDGDHLMMVVDEVHEIGSKINSNALTIQSGASIGLSATPNRYGDPSGTDKIFSYFGGLIEPKFTLVDAIKNGRLVEYEYFPTPIHLSANESEEWERATRKISLEYARSKRDKNGVPIINNRLQNMLIQRSRIAKKASAKIKYALRTIKNNYKDGQSWLVYCEDQTQLQDVLNLLRKNDFPVCEYHTNMTGDPDASMKWFREFGGIMVSIRCLDQGVDIPKISHAIILASSQNPRQFIQRRGRVLRICEGKHKASIFDAIVVPVCLDEEPGQLSLLKSELQRSIQFAKNAKNSSGSNELTSIAINLGIDPDEINMYQTDGIEDLGDKSE
jgi:superfamily II DNA or RNA helicase